MALNRKNSLFAFVSIAFYILVAALVIQFSQHQSIIFFMLVPSLFSSHFSSKNLYLPYFFLLLLLQGLFFLEVISIELDLILVMIVSSPFLFRIKKEDKTVIKSDILIKDDLVDIGLWEYSFESNDIKLNRFLAGELGFEKNKRLSLEAFFKKLEVQDYEKYLLAFEQNRIHKRDFGIKIKTKGRSPRKLFIKSRFCEENGLSYFVGSCIDITYEHMVEQSLRNSYTRLTFANSVGKIGTYEWDLKSDNIVWDDWMHVIFDISKGKFGNTFSEMEASVHLDDLLLFRNQFRDIKDSGRSVDFDFRIVRRDNSIGAINCRAMIRHQDDGMFDSIIGVCVDITERVFIEEETKLLANIVESSHDVIYTYDLKGIITSWNSGAEETYGYLKDDVMGKSVLMLFPENRKFEFVEIFNQIGQGESITALDTERIDSVGNKVSISSSIFPFRDHTNQVIGVSVISQNLTERKILDEQNKFLASVVNSTSDAVISVTDNYKIKTWNKGAENLMGMLEQEVCDKSIFTILPSAQNNKLLNYLKRVFANERLENFELNVWNHQDEQVTVSVSISPVFNSVNEVNSCSIILRDISDQVKQKALIDSKTKELERSNKELENFAYIVSHDLQAPLRTVSSYAKLIQNRLKEIIPVESIEYIDYIQDASDKMKSLITSLLDLSRIGNVESQKIQLDLNQLVNDVKKDLKTDIDQKSGEIFIENLPIIFGNEIQIRQLFQNLFSNAIKYSKDRSPKIVVSCKQNEERFVLISVKDNGIGIPLHSQNQIFDLYKRLDNTRSDSSGLGLAICKKIVDGHRGTIKVTSDGETGTTFFIKLPTI